MAEEKKRPDVLDTLAFAALDGAALISRLARLYISQEETLKRSLNRRARDAYEVSEKTVAPWLRPVYTPPYGKVRETVQLIVTEVKRQTAIRVERQKRRSYSVTYSTKMNKDALRRSVATKLYSFEEKSWNGREYEEKAPNCVHISILGEHVIAVDNRGYSGGTYLYTLSRKTGRAFLGKLDERIAMEGKDLTVLLFKLAPPDVRLAAFTGITVKADIEKLAFYVGETPTIIPFAVDGEPVITQNFTPPRFRLN